MSTIYPPLAPEIATKRRDLAPNQHAAFDALDKAIFADGALPAKTKQIIAVAVAHVTQSPGVHRGPHKGGIAQWGNSTRTDGGDLGRGHNAGRRRLRALEIDARYSG